MSKIKGRMRIAEPANVAFHTEHPIGRELPVVTKLRAGGET
jgi:hypothetical protein